MALLVLVLYAALLYCTWAVIVQGGYVCTLKCSKMYNKRKRHRMIVVARNRLLLLIFTMIALAVAIMAAVGLGTITAW